jgi:hypothetical protein
MEPNLSGTGTCWRMTGGKPEVGTGWPCERDQEGDWIWKSPTNVEDISLHPWFTLTRGVSLSLSVSFSLIDQDVQLQCWLLTAFPCSAPQSSRVVLSLHLLIQLCSLYTPLCLSALENHWKPVCCSQFQVILQVWLFRVWLFRMCYLILEGSEYFWRSTDP